MSESSSDSSSSSSDDEESSLKKKTSYTNFFNFQASTSKSITCCTFDSTGNRIVTGSSDGFVRTWDLSLGASLAVPKPIATLLGPAHQKTFQEESSSSVRTTMTLSSQDALPVDLDFNSTGKLLAVARLDPQITIYDRNVGSNGLPAIPIHTTTRGDPYIHDTSKTKGHVAGVTCVRWSRQKDQNFLTTSSDGSFRVWDVEKGPKALMGTELGCIRAYRLASDKPGVRLAILSADLSKENETLACLVSETGDLQIWPSQRLDFGSTSRPTQTLSFYSDKTSKNLPSIISFSENGRYLACGSESLLKVWDTRMMRAGGFGYQARSGEVFSIENSSIVDIRGLAWTNESSTLAIGCLNGLFSCNLKGKLEEIKVANCTSNLSVYRQSNQLAFGCADGGLCIGFDDDDDENQIVVGARLALSSRRHREWTEEEEGRSKKRSKGNDDQAFVNVDSSALASSSSAKQQQGKIMTGEEYNAMQLAKSRARKAQGQ